MDIVTDMNEWNAYLQKGGRDLQKMRQHAPWKEPEVALKQTKAIPLSR